MSTQASWRYWPALDGVRALAVASVLVFHAAPDLLPGGRLGVDAFFVLWAAEPVSNWWAVHHGATYHAHLWSLGIEGQCYLIWPLLLLFALTRRVPRAALGEYLPPEPGGKPSLSIRAMPECGIAGLQQRQRPAPGRSC